MSDGIHRPSLTLLGAIVVIIAANVVFLSCKKDETPSLIIGPTSPGFSLTITAEDTLAQPVPGLRISAWNALAGVFSPGTESEAGPSPGPFAVSTIGFDVATPARVVLSIFDLDNSPVAIVFDQNLSNTGSYLVQWSIHQNVPTRVYTCRLIAQDTATSTVLFHDSIYAVLWQPDPGIAMLGWTSPLGTFETHDSLLFPNVLSLPPMVQTNSSGPTPLGTFGISDSVTVVLADTSTHRSQTYQRAITRGENTVKLRWAPSGPATTPGAASKVRSQLDHRVRFDAKVHASWALRQNYPNPFN
jgi:hypothetical protein